MLVVNVNKGIWKIGADVTWSVSILDANGVPQSMTGWALRYTVRDKPLSTANVVIDRTSAAGHITLGTSPVAAEQSIVDDTLLITVSDDLTWDGAAILIAEGQYYHDAWRIDPATEVPLFEGYAWLEAAPGRGA